jgi:transcriptional regulator NrdR family protein
MASKHKSSNGRPGVVCPRCECPEHNVVQTRSGRVSSEIHRKRHCEHCGHEWWTRETTIEPTPELPVVKWKAEES